jgi:hypothetical protein
MNIGEYGCIIDKLTSFDKDHPSLLVSILLNEDLTTGVVE